MLDQNTKSNLSPAAQAIHHGRLKKAHAMGRADRDMHEYEEAMLTPMYRHAYECGWRERDLEIVRTYTNERLWS